MKLKHFFSFFFLESPMLRDVKFAPDLLKESDEVYDDLDDVPTTSIINRTE